MWAIVGKISYQIGKISLKSSLVLVAISILFLFVLRNWEPSWIFGGMGGGLGAGLALTMQVMIMKEREEGFLFLRSLPIAPKDIVKAMYFVIVLILAWVLLLGGVVGGIMIEMGFRADKIIATQLTIAWCLMIYTSLYMALCFRFDMRRALDLFYAILLALGLTLLVVIFLMGVPSSGPPPFITNPWFFGSLASLPLFFFLGSMLYSIRVFQRPDFFER